MRTMANFWNVRPHVNRVLPLRSKMNPGSSMAASVPEDGERPLVTFALIAFNQRQFIRQAVEAAFAQTYSPLEIILSDDASTDGTYEILCEMAASYRGPHTIVLNRNAINMGIGGHVSVSSALAKGQLIVRADGDDISHPNRTSVFVRAWLDSGRKATSLFSNARVIDGEGCVTSERYFTRVVRNDISGIELDIHPTGRLTLYPLRANRLCLGNWVCGATHAFDRKLFDLFGPMESRVAQEDMVLTLRSQLARGEIVYLDEALLDYRRHDGNFSPDIIADAERAAPARIRFLEQRTPLHRSRLADVETARKLGLCDAGLAHFLSLRLRFALRAEGTMTLLAKGRRAKALGNCFVSLAKGPRRLAMLRFLLRHVLPEFFHRPRTS